VFIINSGMPKSGTTLLVAYQNDLLRSAFPDNGIEELRKHTYGGYVEVIDEAVAETLRGVHDAFGPFVVKTHREPTPATRDLIENGLAKATFSFRDPRDTVLSGLDHAERTRKGLDPSGAFGDLKTVQDAIALTQGSIGNYRAWSDYGKAMLVRYENLMADKPGHLARMADYFGLNIPEDTLRQIYEQHERQKETAWNFNKGTTERWRTEMSADDIRLCEEAFGSALKQMGYERGVRNEGGTDLWEQKSERPDGPGC
jgi:hypothetical protein